ERATVAIDRNPGRIHLVINSHFHFDDIGGNALVRNATMLVQRLKCFGPGLAPLRLFPGSKRLCPRSVTGSASLWGRSLKTAPSCCDFASHPTASISISASTAAIAAMVHATAAPTAVHSTAATA